MAHTVFRSAYL